MRPWLWQGKKVWSANHVPVICAECPCGQGCAVCSIAHGLTKLSNPVRQDVYPLMYSNYADSGFILENNRLYYRWDYNWYASEDNFDPYGWENLGAAGINYGAVHSFGFYGTNRATVYRAFYLSSYTPVCAYMQREFQEYSWSPSTGVVHYIALPITQPHVVYHTGSVTNCAINTIATRTDRFVDPVLFQDITIEILCDKHIYTQVILVDFSMNDIRISGYREDYDIVVKINHQNYFPDLKSFKVNGFEVASPAYAYGDPATWNYGYRVPAGTIFQNKRFAPMLYREAGGSNPPLKLDRCRLQIFPSGQFGGGDFHIRATGKMALMPCYPGTQVTVPVYDRDRVLISGVADGDWDLLAPVVDALENGYVEVP